MGCEPDAGGVGAARQRIQGEGKRIGSAQYLSRNACGTWHLRIRTLCMVNVGDLAARMRAGATNRMQRAIEPAVSRNMASIPRDLFGKCGCCGDELSVCEWSSVYR